MSNVVAALSLRKQRITVN